VPIRTDLKSRSQMTCEPGTGARKLSYEAKAGGSSPVGSASRSPGPRLRPVSLAIFRQHPLPGEGLADDGRRILPADACIVASLDLRRHLPGSMDEGLQNPRYGCRWIWALFSREGWQFNRKRVHRLWRAEGLKVPVVQHKPRRLGPSENASTHKAAGRANRVWCYGFVMGRSQDGRQLKMLPVVDESTRECPSIDVKRSLTAQDVVARLLQLFERRAAPDFIRCSNGPEFIAMAVKE